VLDEQRLAGPQDLVAFAESAEGGDVFRERVHGGVAIGAISVEGEENRVVVDAIEEFVDRAEAAAEQGEIEWAEGRVEDGSFDE
jgi:hypothetical protein